MSRVTSISCDRCGKELKNKHDCYKPNYNPKTVSAKILLWPVGEYRGNQGQRIDLCEECYDKFVNFLESEDSK